MTPAANNGWALGVTRFIAAPPAKVWDMMTRRQAEWFCPPPWSAEVVAQNWRAGGRDAMMFRGPNGEAMPQEGVFLEVTPGVRFVSTDAFVVDDAGHYMPAGPFMIGIWEIAPEGAGTRYTATARHWDEDAAKRHIDMGFVDGWGVAADQLVVLCEGG